MRYFLILILLSFPYSKSYSSDFDINLCWFENFNDKNLMNYINEAMENNKDVKIARKNILKIRQEKNLKISEEFPNISVGTSYVLLKVPKLAIPNNDIQTNSFALPFITTWEIDYLGKKYNEIQKAKYDFKNSLYELKSSRLIVAVDLSSAYFNVSNLNKQIELQEKKVELKKEIFKRKEKMFKAGTISTTELNNEKENLLNEKNNLESLYKQKEIFLTQIACLIGKSPYLKDEIVITPFDEINYTGIYPEKFSGTIVLNRPDILKLDNEIKKAKLDITIAKKDFLPNINVIGILAFSTIVQNFNWQGALAALTAGATQTLFDGGKRIFTLKKRKTEYDIALENYIDADLNALKEVNDALYTLKKDLKIYENNQSRQKAANSNFVNAFKSYNQGAKSYVDYIRENSEYINKEEVLNNSKNQNFNNLLSIYKAVGGEL